MSRYFAQCREPVSSYTHFLGAVASALGTVFLVGRCVRTGASGVVLAGAALFGLSLVALYSASSIYHAALCAAGRLRRLRKLDHAMIYVLIAGSYTPLCIRFMTPAKLPLFLGALWVLAVLGIVFLRPIAVLLGAKGELLDYAVRYGRILMVSLPTFALQNMFQSFFVTAEKPHLGFYFTVGAGCTNMVLDVLLVGILHWSVEGAAIATMLSQVVGGLLPVFYFLNRNNTSLLHLCRPQFEGGVLLKACVNGSSELMTNLSMSLVNILYNYQLLRFAGEDGVAAYGVIMYASFLFVAVFVGYAVGSAPIVSYHYGANNRKEVNNLYRKSLKLIGVVAVGMTIGSMFIIPHVARFFVGYDENLLILTTRAFRLYGLSFLIMGFNVYASSFFTALGDGVTSALISFLRTLLFQVAAVLLLPLLLGIDGIWLAVTAAELAALLVSIGLFITRDQQFHYRKAE